MGRLSPKERRFLAEILYGFITRDTTHRRGAFRGGYVPRHHSVETSRRRSAAIGEPITTAEPKIFDGEAVDAAFRSQPPVRPSHAAELLLLQKTMVVVEGVTRSLDSQARLWAVAEPVVRDWIERHLGPQACIEGAADGAGELGPLPSAACRRCSRAARRWSSTRRHHRDGLCSRRRTVAPSAVLRRAATAPRSRAVAIAVLLVC